MKIDEINEAHPCGTCKAPCSGGGGCVMWREWAMESWRALRVFWLTREVPADEQTEDDVYA